MMRIFPDSIKRSAVVWIQQGISPRRLALTLALGFAIGCIPVVGIPTVLCAGLALALRLNQPAIQAANYVAMPLQFILIVPFVRMGGWLFAAEDSRQTLTVSAVLHLSPWGLYTRVGGLAGHAMLAWLVVAAPSVALMTLMLTLMLRRIPALATVETAN
jgi:uncharacterized protein (DUF2062 family)